MGFYVGFQTEVPAQPLPNHCRAGWAIVVLCQPARVVMDGGCTVVLLLLLLLLLLSNVCFLPVPFSS